MLCVLCLVAKVGNNTCAVFIHRGIVEGDFLRGVLTTRFVMSKKHGRWINLLEGVVHQIHVFSNAWLHLNSKYIEKMTQQGKDVQ